MTPAAHLRAVRAFPLLSAGRPAAAMPSHKPFGSSCSSGSSVSTRGLSCSLGRRPPAAPLIAATRQQVRYGSTFPDGHRSESTTTTPLSSLARSAANPPASTRPPPLALPQRDANTSTFSFLLQTGKAYLAFYKTGLRQLYTNYKLVRDIGKDGRSTTRADLLLRRRWRHDVRRLPVFALLLLVCGEFTPLVVLAVPHVVPYPCRIPKQVAKLRRQAADRRAHAFADLGNTLQAENTATPSPAVACTHVCRSLGLVSPLWDRLLGGWVPGPLARRGAAHHLRFLAEDDALLRQSGGAAALEAAEVVLACADRGVDDVVAEGDGGGELREVLATWLRLTAEQPPSDGHMGGSANNAADNAFDSLDATQRRQLDLLTKRPDAWPLK